MKATLTDEQKMIANFARAMSESGIEDALRVCDGHSWPLQPDSSLFEEWSQLGIMNFELGLTTGLVESALLVYSLSQKVTPNRFTSHLEATQVANAAGLFSSADLDATERFCLAVDEVGVDPFGPFDTHLVGSSVFGKKQSVLHAPGADMKVVILGDDLVALTVGGHISPSSSLDRLNPVFDITFDKDEIIVVSSGAHKGMQRAAIILSADLCGVARGAVEQASMYAKSRKQFGKEIGNFQGVAHQLADAYVAAETAWSLTLFAAWSLENDLKGAKKNVHEAKASASKAAVFCAERALQVFGGMGMTWEVPAHIFLRRALAGASRFGSAHWHRCQTAKEVLKTFPQK